MHAPGEVSWYSRQTAAETAANHLKPFGSTVGSLLAEAGAILSLLPPPPAQVLDAGCADGHLTHLMQLQGYDVMGVDICADEINDTASRQVYWRGNASAPEFQVADFDHLPALGFDAVVFSGALHHSLDRRVTLRSAFRALRPGGVVVACEPGLGHGWSRTSREWAKKYNVTERSCPPIAVAWAGRQAGFRGVKAYPHPGTWFKLAYPRAAACDNGFVKALRWVPLATSLLTAAKWLHGITVLTKPK